MKVPSRLRQEASSRGIAQARYNNASSAPSSIFPPTVFPRFDIERLALPRLRRGYGGDKADSGDRPPFSRDGLPSLASL